MWMPLIPWTVGLEGHLAEVNQLSVEEAGESFVSAIDARRKEGVIFALCLPYHRPRDTVTQLQRYHPHYWPAEKLTSLWKEARAGWYSFSLYRFALGTYPAMLWKKEKHRLGGQRKRAWQHFSFTTSNMLGTKYICIWHTQSLQFTLSQSHQSTSPDCYLTHFKQPLYLLPNHCRKHRTNLAQEFLLPDFSYLQCRCPHQAQPS